MKITATMVKELRERTGSGMMECKKALNEVAGDMELAVEHLRKTGLAKADKKASNIAAEGLIGYAADGKSAVLVEVNCQNDLVSGGEEFAALTKQVTDAVIANRPADVEALSATATAEGPTVEEARQSLIQKIGENITVRRFEIIEAADGEVVGAYQHGNKISVLTRLSGGSEDLAKDVAMHVAASSPVCISSDEVPAELLAKEREIFSAQAAESGKPAEIMEKMVEGRIRKYLNEVTLLGQAFVKDPDQTVEKLVKSAGAEVKQFVRYEVGEGIEKKEDDFVSEVMAQAGKA